MKKRGLAAFATRVMKRSFPSLSTLAIASLLLLFSQLSIPSSMAEAPEETAVSIVYVEKPEGEDPEAFHIRTLAAVLGSEKAAKDAVVYHYKHAASGFSAKLTRSQVEELSKQPGVIQVVPSRTLSLHGPRARTGRHLGVV